MEIWAWNSIDKESINAEKERKNGKNPKPKLFYNISEYFTFLIKQKGDERGAIEWKQNEENFHRIWIYNFLRGSSLPIQIATGRLYAFIRTTMKGGGGGLIKGKSPSSLFHGAGKLCEQWKWAENFVFKRRRHLLELLTQSEKPAKRHESRLEAA